VSGNEDSAQTQDQDKQQSLGSRATTAVAWTTVGFGLSQGIRLASNLVLARLLFPEAFGLMAIAGVLLQGLLLFSDFGIGPSIIQNKAGDDRNFLDTAWTMQCIRGLALTLISVLVASPFAQFYEDDRLFLVVIAIGCSAFFQGLTSTKIFSVGRHLNLKRLTIIEVACQVIGSIVTIGWALLSPTYWALAAGALATPISKVVLSQLALEGPVNRFRWHAPSAHAVFHYGKWIFLGTALTFFAGQSDRLIFAKLVPLDILGRYSMAAMIAILPLTLFGRMTSRVIFPVYSTVIREGRDLAPVFIRLRTSFLSAAGLICAILVAAGPSIIEVMYDERYHEAGWMLQYLTLGSWLTLVQSTYGAAHLASARARWVAAASFMKIVGIVVLVTIGYRTGGFEGAVLGYSASEFLRYLVLAFGGRVMNLPGLGQDVMLSSYVALSAALGILVSEVSGAAAAGSLTSAIVIVATVTTLWVPLLYKHLGKSIAQIRNRESAG
jgi:O-antigen/teichoic acid export membrane protein